MPDAFSEPAVVAALVTGGLGGLFSVATLLFNTFRPKSDLKGDLELLKLAKEAKIEPTEFEKFVVARLNVIAQSPPVENRFVAFLAGPVFGSSIVLLFGVGCVWGAIHYWPEHWLRSFAFSFGATFATLALIFVNIEFSRQNGRR